MIKKANEKAEGTMHKTADEQDTIARIRQGLEEVRQGLFQDLEEVFAELENEL